MSLTLSINRFKPSAEAAPPPAVGLAPEVLLRAGILRDPNDPEQAYARARTLARHGHYREARNLITPHARTTDDALSRRITELLARCALYGAGGDAEQLLGAALAAHQKANDVVGVARMHRDLGELHVAQGRFDEADAQLKRAHDLFIAQGERSRAGLVECLRARARVAAGLVERATARIEAALHLLAQEGDVRGLSLARLEKARILALQGDGEAAAKELVAADRYLSTSGSALERLMGRLARAECLYYVGEPRRAADGLKRILIDVVDLEEASIRAFVHTLLGQCLADLHPSAARQYLMRGRHLYETLKQDYHVTRCDIALARVEQRIGLNARSRLKTISGADLGRWPLLAAEYNIARALVSAERDPERAREALLRSRAFAAENHNHALLAQADHALLTTGLVAGADKVLSESLAPGLLVEAGSIAAPASLTRPRPEPYQISDVTDRDIVIAPRLNSAARLITGDTTPRTNQGLRPPRAVGVGRR